MSANSESGLFALCGCFMGLSTISIGLRIYCRKRQSLPLKTDDWTALFGVVTYIAACALAIELVVLKAYGYDAGTITPAQAAARAKPTVRVGLSYDFLVMNTLACAKLSAMFLYRRLLNVPKRAHFNTITWATVAVIAAWYIAFDALSLLQCRSHFSAYWDGTFKKYCTLNPVWAQGFAISDLILDIGVLLLPIPRIWSLHISVQKKLSVIGVFLLAFIGLGASITRVVIFFLNNAPGRAVLYIGVLESGMTITVVNLPPSWHICVSTMQRNLASLSRLRTRTSNSSYSKSDVSSHTTESKTADLSRMIRTDVSWNSKLETGTAKHDLGANREKDGFEACASVTQGCSRVEAVKGNTDGLPSNVIRVQNEVEVRHDRLLGIPVIEKTRFLRLADLVLGVRRSIHTHVW